MFNYLIEKINLSNISKHPFNHIHIKNFFKDDHFREITNSFEIVSPNSNSDLDLINSLETKGYKSINFPGSVTSKDQYVDWRRKKLDQKKSLNNINTSTEGFGYVLRLFNESSVILKECKSFFSSSDFIDCIKNKFNLSGSLKYDGGIQKYLDGYEISPHPDVRKKAATWMININPGQGSDLLDMHTHYMKFNKERSYIQTFLENNTDIDRPWVPWDWAKSIFQQKSNNSIVIFSPNDNTLHAVKASYNHLLTQRTQIYGNLWYENIKTEYTVRWEELDLRSKKTSAIKRLDKGQGKRNI